jgi:hypothetical protein
MTYKNHTRFLLLRIVLQITKVTPVKYGSVQCTIFDDWDTTTKYKVMIKGRCKHVIFDDWSAVTKYRIMLRVNLLLVYFMTEIPLPNTK